MVILSRRKRNNCHSCASGCMASQTQFVMGKVHITGDEKYLCSNDNKIHRKGDSCVKHAPAFNGSTYRGMRVRKVVMCRPYVPPLITVKPMGARY